MGDITHTYTAKSSGTKKWKAYAEDSCGNKDYGTWSFAMDANNKGPQYALATTGTSFSQSNGVASITGPSQAISGGYWYALKWTSSKVSGTTLTLTLKFDIPADPVPLIKKWLVGPGYMGAGIDVYFALSDEAVANGVDPNDVTLYFSTARQEVTVTSQNGGCQVKWGIQWQNRNNNYVDILMTCSNNNSDGCFSLACVSGPYDLTNGDNSMLPTDRKWIMIQQNSQTIGGVQYKSYNGSVAVGIGYVNTFSGNCGNNDFVFMYQLPA